MVNTRSGKKSKFAPASKGKGKMSPPAKKQKSVDLQTPAKTKPSLSEKVTEPEVFPSQPIESQNPTDSGDSSHSPDSKSIVHSTDESVLRKGDDGKTSKSSLHNQESIEAPAATSLLELVLEQEA
ncbi:hypothetical protein PanWU01x14_136160, partial [Parasponia andersonii]